MLDRTVTQAIVQAMFEASVDVLLVDANPGPVLDRSLAKLSSLFSSFSPNLVAAATYAQRKVRAVREMHQ